MSTPQITALGNLNARHFTDERISQIVAGDPLTETERTFLITDTPQFEECDLADVSRLREMTDVELMQFAYSVWRDYARTQG